LAPAAVVPIASIVVISEVPKIVDRGDARAGRDAVDLDSAGAAERHPAAELRAGHSEHIAQYPEQRRVAIDIDGAIDTIDFDLERHGYLLMSIH